jgi:hypothetical protein
MRKKQKSLNVIAEGALTNEAMKMRKRTMKTLLRKVKAAAEGSPELDAEFASAFPSAPAKVTRSLDAVVRLIETELQDGGGLAVIAN